MARDLTPLFDPRSVAIMGASNDPAKWGNWLARGALKGEGRRPVYLVNRNGGEVLGRPAYRSLAELPGAPDLVVVSVPAPAFEQAVDDALESGARALVGITAGLGELGDEGKRREEALVERVRAAGAMLLGPNCLGVFDASSDLGICSNELPPGSIGLISQSGNLALELGLLAADHGLGFSRFASTGNQADVDLAELVADFASHEASDMIAIYVEDFRDGRAFVDAAAACSKPVILLTVGRSDASVRAARSHTGALVSDLAVVEAACRAAGVRLVSSPAQMMDLAAALATPRRAAGSRIAVLGDGGGHGAIACDAAAAVGLELPRMSLKLSSELAAQLPPTAATANPVDLAGGGEQDFFSYARTARTILESGEVDGLLLTGYFGGYSQYSEEFLEREVEVARGVAAAARDSGRPLVTHTMYPGSPTAQALRDGGVPVYRTIEAAAWAMAQLREGPPAKGAPPVPAAAPSGAVDGYFAARALLEEAGVPFVLAHRVETLAELREAVDGLGYPVVLKALGQLHKSDAGGVAVGLVDDEDLEQAYTAMTERLDPPAFSVEQMAPLADGVELIVGARRDPRFGMVAMVGLGGVYTELFGDVAVGLAPLDPGEAERMLRSLRGAALLAGARGRPAVDIAAAARAAAALSAFAAARPDIAEIEINPLLATPAGALGLDARILSVAGGADAG
jgi:acyl-CoA synthetase (NDP forming)